MSEKRKPIEEKIQELSREILSEIPLQRNYDEPMPINTDKIELMLYQWHLLAIYYEDGIFNRPNDAEFVDTEISLSIVHNYLYWTDLLQTLMSSSSKKGFRELAEIYDEHLNTIEIEMRRILRANSDVNNPPYE